MTGSTIHFGWCQREWGTFITSLCNTATWRLLVSAASSVPSLATERRQVSQSPFHTVAGASFEPKADIIQEPLEDATHQDWCFIPTVDGFYRIMNRKSGQAINAVYAPNEPNAGKEVYQFWYWGGKQQAWALDFASPAPKVDARPAECMGFPPNTFYHIIANHSGKALRRIDPNNVVQDNLHSDSIENWRFVSVGNGHYRVFNQRTGLALSCTSNLIFVLFFEHPTPYPCSCAHSGRRWHEPHRKISRCN